MGGLISSGKKEQLINLSLLITPQKESVASTGIEPVSGASETLILSIVLRGQFLKEPNNKKQVEKPETPDLVLVYCFLRFILSIRLHSQQISLLQWPAKLRRKIYVPPATLPFPVVFQSTAMISIPGKQSPG
jgi:hypothetical protein